MDKFLELQKIETRINKLVYNALNANRFDLVNESYYSHLNANKRKWSALMIELRGWDDYQGSNITKQSWKDYCDKKGLYYNYDVSDVMA